MLPTFYREYDRDALPRIQKTVSGEDASNMGAFSFGTRVELCVRVPRRLGAAAVVLRLHEDGCPAQDMPLRFVHTECGVDTYRLTLDTAVLCGEHECGLFFYELLFVRGADTLFTNSKNNVDFTLSDHSASQFSLLIYDKNYTAPAWFSGGVMYHIFIDRFCRGQGPARLREDAVFDPDWENGIPQYGPYPGAEVANNVFFGGNLWGIAEKLDYLRALGVTVLYLSPIFEAASNHKYDTGDYEKVDEGFGGEAALAHLLAEARARGMRVILDGVFNHTGSDSRYFDRFGRYGTNGAYTSKASPYYDWYTFRDYPDDYECWWGVKILPRLNSALPSVRDYLAGENGVAASRVREGLAGWRLDVADELSDEFLDTLRQSLHTAGKEQPLIIGEVWENAAVKIAYGHRRRYFWGGQLDSVMNYPLREGIIAFVRDGDARLLYDTLTELYGTYPRPVCHALMNLLGTHDTERILSVLGDPCVGDDRTNAELSVARMSPEERALGLRRLRAAFSLLFTVFGVPSVFYGDEAGMEGHRDPFCRRPYPWGREETPLRDHVRDLGALRATHPCLKDGDFRVLHIDDSTLAYERVCENDRLVVAANMSDKPWCYTDARKLRPVLSTAKIDPADAWTVPAGEVVIFEEVAP
ncbi:MAG: glycoside hydrolase family 13 protein [Clostridia bacterium]|nr:glycoside hydrolase family 13 protein [Clostridia bacterium]